jgi:hypothetical protein
MAFFRDALMQWYGRWAIGQANSSPTVEQEDPEMPESTGYGRHYEGLWSTILIVCAVRTAWNQLPLEWRFVAVIWVVSKMITKAPPGFRLFLSRRSEDEQGIMECILSGCIAKRCGCRCREGPRAKGGKPGAVVSVMCLARSVLSVPTSSKLWQRYLLTANPFPRGVQRVARSVDWE